jgi:hypothetical protein
MLRHNLVKLRRSLPKLRDNFIKSSGSITVLHRPLVNDRCIMVKQRGSSVARH